MLGLEDAVVNLLSSALTIFLHFFCSNNISSEKSFPILRPHFENLFIGWNASARWWEYLRFTRWCWHKYEDWSTCCCLDFGMTSFLFVSKTWGNSNDDGFFLFSVTGTLILENLTAAWQTRDIAWAPVVSGFQFAYLMAYLSRDAVQYLQPSVNSESGRPLCLHNFLGHFDGMVCDYYIFICVVYILLHLYNM
jgi:hypothetical protein